MHSYLISNGFKIICVDLDIYHTNITKKQAKIRGWCQAKKKLVINLIYAKWQIKRSHVTRAACNYNFDFIIW